jgi:hypothetical protein
VTARLTCGHCGVALDPDAPGAGCPTCLGEAPSIVGALREPGATSRRDTGTASGSRSAPVSSLARVYAIACAVAGEGQEVTEADMALASAIHRSPVDA